MKINNVWELIIVINMMTTVAVHAIKDGEERKLKYNFVASIYAGLFAFLLFYLAGLFR